MSTVQTNEPQEMDYLPPLDHYIAASLAAVQTLAAIERAADLLPGALIDDWIEGIESNSYDRAALDNWARWIADGYVDDDGEPLDEEEVRRMLKPVFAAREVANSGNLTT